MRKLMYFVLGFAAASGACGYFLPEQYRKGILLVAILLGAVLLLLGREQAILRRIAIVLLGCGAGLAWFACYENSYLAPAMILDGQVQAVSIRAADYSYETSYGLAFDGSLTLEGRNYQVKVYLKDSEPVYPGTQLTGEFRFRVTAPDAQEESLYYQGKGIFLLAYQQGELSPEQTEETWLDKVAKLRRKIGSILEETFPQDTSPFAKALLLGDSSDLDYETDTSFKLSGIRHVIAVSGLHVSILFALISTVTFRKRFLTALVGCPALFLFAALAGFTPSVVRACLMSGLMLLALLAGREYDGATALAFAVLVMLLLNPLVITSESFQLSVSSVAGIFLFEPAIRAWLLARFGDLKKAKFRRTLANWFSSSISVTLSAMTLTTPLCAAYFGTVSLVGVVTNLLCLWVISVTFYGIGAVCLAFLISPTGAVFLAKLISIAIRYILLTADILGKLPLAAVYTRSPYIIVWLILGYALLVLFLMQRKKQQQTLFCCVVITLCVALMASWTEPMLDELRFSVLDVGQGQCLLMQYRGKTIMVDCGGDSDSKTADIAAETLLSQGISKLDCLILTHLDRDHAGAAGNFLSRIDTELLILPAVATALPEMTEGRVICAAEDLSLTCGDMTVKIFTPNFPGNSNEMSLCILFDTEKCDILITGDRNGFGERSLLRSHDISDVDILVAGHHGSKNSTCDELLTAVTPEIVCISVGADNSYGHPAPELLQRLYEHGCTVYRTDKSGTIVIRR